ncbi:RIP metalloprotease RseP [bacterium]|nr:RIP metalloprotease RseP [bacterium]
MLDFLVGNDLLSALVAFAIVLIPAIIVHELGHFLAAKAAGITVLEFGIGFPPRIARLFTWGETEFTINWIPLGGFVRPLGEDFVKPVSEEETTRARASIETAQGTSPSGPRHNSETYLSEREELAQRGIYEAKAVNEATPLQRIIFFSAGALANFLIALVLFVVIGFLGVAEEVGVRLWLVDVPSESSFAAAGIQPDDFIEAVDGQIYPSAADLIAALADLAGEEAQLRIVRAADENGETIEVREVTVLVDETFIATLEEARYVRVLTVVEDTPAADAGLQPGDLIAGINGDSIVNDADPILRLQEASREFAGEEITLTISRDGETLILALTPSEEPPRGVGRIGIGIDEVFGNADTELVYRAGAPQVELVPQPPGEAIAYGINRTLEIFQLIGEFPSRLLQGDTQPGETRIISVVGVTQLGGEFLQDSIEENEPVLILQYIALISIALGITNLLPIPALDGGRILFVLVEIVRGRPIPPEREGVVHLVGLIFLLSIAVIFIINDLINPLTDILP